MQPVPPIRIRTLNDAPVRPRGDFVLYWMIAQRRTRWNFALQHAVLRGAELGVPVLVLEPLRLGYRWASDRLHRFVIDGMADNAAACEAAGVRYHAYVEPAAGDGKGLLRALAERACLVVTDEFPCFFLPRMVATAAERLDVRLEQVDGNGLLPLRASTGAFPTAYAFRRFLQKELPRHLAAFPAPNPLAALELPAPARIPRAVLDRWPAVPAAVLRGDQPAFLAELAIDHAVRPVARRGGSAAGDARADDFLSARLAVYADDRNDPDADASSGLSPYLHFGHVSVHGVVAGLLRREGWQPSRLAGKANGSREGWWGASREAEAFLDELVTWREVGYAFCHHRPHDYDRYASLPDWARRTLAEHADDPREHVYDLATLEAADTHDELWNAAQRQLVDDGVIHNYLRMLWGKKILEWTESPAEALRVLIELNNKYALDGRNPNSYSGIFWTLGRFDRPWGPERPIFGKIRYMSSANTRRKLSVDGYLAAHAPS